MPDPQSPQTPQSPQPTQTPTAPLSPLPAAPTPTHKPLPNLFSVPIFDASAVGAIQTPAAGKVEPGLNLRFNNGDGFGASTLLNIRTQSVERYGVQSRVHVGETATLGLSAETAPEKDSSKFAAKLKLGDAHAINANGSAEVSPKGTQFQFGAGASTVDKEVTVSAEGRVGKINGGGVSVSYDDKTRVKVEGSVAVDDRAGNVGVGQAKVSASIGREAHRLEIGADYDAGARSASARIGYVFDHGARSAASAPVDSSIAPPTSAPGANDAALARLSPKDRELYRQAEAAVERFNETNAVRVPVQETAAALAALAKEGRLTRIDSVIAVDRPGGAQTLFAIQGDVRDPWNRPVSGDRDTLARTPVDASVFKLLTTPDPQEQAPTQKPQQRQQ